MNKRSPVQQQHERAVVEKFLKWMNRRRGSRFVVIEEPNPPDAIIRSARVTKWVEVVDAFWAEEYAHDLYSAVTPGEIHEPIRPGPYRNMDRMLAWNLVRGIAKKLKKRSYLPFLQRYGPGYLIVSVHSPFFDRPTLDIARGIWATGRPWDDLGCFKEVYLEDGMIGSSPFRRWRL